MKLGNHICYIKILQTENQIKKHAQLLEQAVEEKTREMEAMSERLVRQEKLAAMGKLAGILGHEIKAPLGVIKHSFEYLDLRLDQNMETKIGEHLKLVHKKLKTIDQSIDEILDFARTKKIELNVINLNNLLENVIRNYPVASNIKIKLNLGSDLPFIAVDEIQIQQVFQNMITNASEAMDEAGTLTVNSYKHLINSEHKFVEISFQDTGEGISSDDIEKVFEPLFSTKAKGTGLGLAVCENIVRAHKGHIEILSELGKGSTFIVKLPI